MENTPPLDFPPLIDAPQSEAEIAVLPPATRAVIALKASKTEFDMRAMVAKHAGLVEIKDKAGREQVHGAAMELMRARTAVKRVADEVRDDAKKFNAAVIAEEKRLAAIVEGEETRLKALRDAWDTEQENIKREAEKRDRERVMAITERIAAIRGTAARASACRTSERVSAILDSLMTTDLTGFDEFEAEAHAAFTMAKESVTTIRDAKLADEEAARVAQAEREAEQRRMDAQRAELEAKEAAQKAEADRLAAQAAEIERLRAEMEAQRATIPVVVAPEQQPVADLVNQLAEAGIALADDLLNQQAPAADAPVEDWTLATAPPCHQTVLIGVDLGSGPAVVAHHYQPLAVDVAQPDDTQDPTDAELMTVVIDAVSGYFGMSEEEAARRLNAIATWGYVSTSTES
jgi:hypothetical protein